MIVKHSPLIVKLAQLFSKLAQLFNDQHPLIVKHSPVIVKLAQLFGNFTAQLSSWTGYSNLSALRLLVSLRHLTEVWQKPPVSGEVANPPGSITS